MSSDFYDGHQTFDFGEAIRRLKAGHRVSRAGWNGKGMWIVLFVPDEEIPSQIVTDDGVFPVDPCIAMKTAGGSLQPGWLASQADILAEDWSVAP